MGLAVYNGERFLEQALASLLAQDFEDFEIVLSDNASDDRTETICRDLQSRDPRIVYHRNATNVGAARNYNRVFELAQGRYFKWTAHDDVYEPTYLSRCVEVLEERPDVSLVYAATADIDDDGETICVHPVHPYADQDDIVERIGSFLGYNSACVETFGLARREQFARTSLIGPYTSSDRTWMLEMALQGKFHEIPDVLFHHRQHSGRSMKAHKDPRDRLAWFDPDLADRLVMPRWRLLAEYARAIAGSDLGLVQRLRCLGFLLRWLGPNRRALVRDVVGVARYASHRALRPASR